MLSFYVFLKGTRQGAGSVLGRGGEPQTRIGAC